MATDRFTFEDVNAAAGPQIHFQSIQAEDQHIFGVLIDVKQCKVMKDVHRIYRQRYRFISVFAMEEIYNEINTFSLGSKGRVDLRPAGDVLYSLALVSTYPDVSFDQLVTGGNAGDLTIKKFCYTTNLGAAQIKQCTIEIEAQAVDQVNTNNLVVLSNLMERQDQVAYYNQMVGNTALITTPTNSIPMFKTLTQFKMFFTDSSQKAFPWLRAGQPKVHLQISLRSADDLVCYTRNLSNTQWTTTVKPTQIGLLSTEIFLGEHERIIHGNTNATYLIEQNFNYEQKYSQQALEPSFLHPAKFLYWAIQKEKYQKGNYFLAFDSFAPDAVRNIDDLLADATTRFVMRYAQYKAVCDYASVDGYGGAKLIEAVAAIATSELNKANFLGSASDALILFSYDNYEVIKSCFDSNTLSAEQNTTSFSIDTIFKRLQAQPILTNDTQYYKKDVSIILNNLLTLEEASVPLEIFDTHVPSGIQAFGAQNCSANIATVLFSMYSNGFIPIRHGTTQQFSVSTTTSYIGKNLFSIIVRSAKFNYGHSDFDICVKQWDNYGKYINKTGDSIRTTEFSLGQTPRFKKAGFYTSQYHQKKYFPGRSCGGVHIYSFAQSPESLQPSGSLNFSRASGKFKIVTDSDITSDDTIFINAQVYNVIEFAENTFQQLFATPMSSTF